MALRELLVATMFILVLIIFMVVAGPTISGVADEVKGKDTPGGSEPYDTSGKIETVTFLSLTGVPTVAGLGIIIWAYAAIARKESYRGRL